jgi:hypothetical protein
MRVREAREAGMMKIRFTTTSLLKNGGKPYWSLTRNIGPTAGWIALAAGPVGFCFSWIRKAHKR